MKIALYYPYLHLRSGVERTILEILRNSRHQWQVFTNRYELRSTFQEFAAFEKQITELKRISVRRSFTTTAISAFTILFQKIPLAEYNALWIHNEGLGDLVNFSAWGIPHICFCHTPLKIVYDQHMKHDYLQKYPWKFPVYMVFSLLFRVLDHMAFRRFDWCFCVSKEVQRRIVENGLLPVRYTEVLYRGVDIVRFSPGKDSKPFFFHPTRIKWWKNIELSIDAFVEFQRVYDTEKKFSLVIAGDLYETNIAYYRAVKKRIGANSNIQLHINPREEELVRYYQESRAVLSTTRNEDFGLTVLEAFACAKPVVAVARGGPSEMIMHGETGFLAEDNPQSFSKYMNELARDEIRVRVMGKKARNQAEKYDWKKFVAYIDCFLEDYAWVDKEEK